jgi:Cu/Ag efflux pump CusA
VCYNDQGEVPGAIVMMLKGENSSDVIRNVKEKIAAIQKTLPEGVVIEAFLDRTKMVNNAISTVETNLLEGALIVVFVLVFFFGQCTLRTDCGLGNPAFHAVCRYPDELLRGGRQPDASGCH